MEWLVFLLTIFAWFFSLVLARENPTFFRKGLFAFVTLSFGFGLLLTGVDFPNGFTTSTSGGITSQVVQYINYVPTCENVFSPGNGTCVNGSTGVPILFGFSWALSLLGILGLLFVFVDSFGELQRIAGIVFSRVQSR